MNALPQDRRSEYLELADGLGPEPHPDDRRRLQELSQQLTVEDQQSLPGRLSAWDNQLRQALTTGPSLPSQWTNELRAKLRLPPAEPSPASYPHPLPTPVSLDTPPAPPGAPLHPRTRRAWWAVIAVSFVLVVVYGLRPQTTRRWSEDQIAQACDHWLKEDPPSQWQDWQPLTNAPRDRLPSAIRNFSRLGWRNSQGPEGIAARIYQLPLAPQRFAYLIRLSAVGNRQMPANFSWEPTHHYRSDWSLWVCSHPQDSAIWVLAHDGELSDIQARLSPTQLTQYPRWPNLLAWSGE